MRLLKSLLLSCLFFVASAVFAVSAQAAPHLYYDPASFTPGKNSDFTITIKIDVENRSTFGADVTVNYPSNDLVVKSVYSGGYYSDFTYGQGTGILELHGYMSPAFASKSGGGDFAKIVFSSNKDSGSGAVSFACNSSGDTQIYDTNSQNILDCGNINQLNLNYSSTSGTFPEPNLCGGTCGSNYNCKAPLYCYQGFCRNPDCKSDLTCGCKATATPTPTKKATARPVASPKGGEETPEVIALNPYTPPPSSTPIVLPTFEATPAPESGGGFDIKKVGILVGAGILALAAVLMLIGSRKKGPPKITPPSQTSNPPVTGYPPPPPGTMPPQNPTF